MMGERKYNVKMTECKYERNEKTIKSEQKVKILTFDQMISIEVIVPYNNNDMFQLSI